MLSIDFNRRSGGRFKLLCVGAHSDDIEIGCGGTVLRLLEENNDLEVRWVVLSAAGERAGEAAKSAERFLSAAKQKEVILKTFRDGFFPYIGAEIKEFFEVLKSGYSPDLILTHQRGDLHQDHRLVSDLTWNTFRDHLILEYEIAKYDGDFGNPGFYVPLSASVCRKKIAILMESFTSQKQKRWFTEDTFLSILRLRGLESNAAEKYAEAFHCRKLVY